MKVAGRARVSLGTVSRVLNNDIHVARDAREHVSVIICELVDGLLLMPLRNPAGYMGTLTNTSFPLVLIDDQGTDSLCPAVGAQHGMPGQEPGVVDYAGCRLPVCA